MELTTWEYGEVAKVLHLGDYDAEAPDIERLKVFIETQGYEISGLHEEEYFRGPGWFFAGNPDCYQTPFIQGAVLVPVQPQGESPRHTLPKTLAPGRGPMQP